MLIKDKLYFNEIITYLHSVVIKNIYFAETSRERLAELTRQDVLDEEIPYYRNMLGEYTSLDTPMYVKSEDTGEEILFSVENLALHKKTRAIYRPGQAKYNDLRRKYPTQTELIRSIVYPVDNIETILNAKNYSLLKSDTTLLHKNEAMSIESAVKKALDYIEWRWDIPEYSSEVYQPIVVWSYIMTHLFNVIALQRMKNIFTPRVHPDDIWEYLGSEGLDDFRESLNDEQELFLYINLRYIINNRGKMSNLRILADKLLSPFGVVLRTKSVMLSKEELIENANRIPEVISGDINTDTSLAQDSLDGIESLDNIILREWLDGLEPEYNADIVQKQDDELSFVNTTFQPTKLIELNNAVGYDMIGVELEKYAINTLLYRYGRGEIDFIVSIPISGVSEPLQLTLGEAIALCLWCIEMENSRSMFVEASTSSSLIGKHVWFDGSIELVTEDTHDTYIGHHVLICADDVIPTKFFTTGSVKTGYKEMIPEYVSYQDKMLYTRSYVDYENTIFDIPETDYFSIHAPDAFMEALDKEFAIVIRERIRLTGDGCAEDHAVMSGIFDNILVHEEDFTARLVSRTTSYSEWIRTYPTLKTVINNIVTGNGIVDGFIGLGNAVSSAILPLEVSPRAAKSGLSRHHYRQMRKLFRQLCSYNIAFMDTQRAKDMELNPTPIVQSIEHVHVDHDKEFFNGAWLDEVKPTTASFTTYEEPYLEIVHSGAKVSSPLELKYPIGLENGNGVIAPVDFIIGVDMKTEYTLSNCSIDSSELPLPILTSRYHEYIWQSDIWGLANEGWPGDGYIDNDFRVVIESSQEVLKYTGEYGNVTLSHPVVLKAPFEITGGKLSCTNMGCRGDGHLTMYGGILEFTEWTTLPYMELHGGVINGEYVALSQPYKQYGGELAADNLIMHDGEAHVYSGTVISTQLSPQQYGRDSSITIHSGDVYISTYRTNGTPDDGSVISFINSGTEGNINIDYVYLGINELNGSYNEVRIGFVLSEDGISPIVTKTIKFKEYQSVGTTTIDVSDYQDDGTTKHVLFTYSEDHDEEGVFEVVSNGNTLTRVQTQAELVRDTYRIDYSITGEISIYFNNSTII